MVRFAPILATTIGVALSLGMVELIIRISEQESLTATTTSLTSITEDDRSEPVGILKRYRSELNSFRYHDSEWRRKQAKGSWRTVVLGDSFTEGKSVARANLFTERIEANLNQRANGSRTYEILNVAHAGWGTHNELLALKALIEAGVTFDSVVLVYFINDATKLESNPILVSALEKQKQRAQENARSWSRTWAWFMQKRDRQELTELTLTDYREAFENSADQAASWKRSQNALAQIRDLSRMHRFDFGVVMFPVLAELTEKHQLVDLYARVGDFCTELDMPYRSLLPAFIGHAAQDLWVSPVNAHANARGHAIAATAIEAFLIEEQLVPDPSAIGTDRVSR